jgi:hypothetical protein
MKLTCGAMKLSRKAADVQGSKWAVTVRKVQVVRSYLGTETAPRGIWGGGEGG